ncbi:PIG-L family deacetylase [Microcoleus sp. FACHB-1515]|uniref:PIG-L deacetylase family protein n=1 Tax=Cyanophyceae TaxID=3028117 RepID=UPI00168942F5|nr:PIG-L deacetylase family protein [Microcoleus sp. FACHB-1515]MBD2091241.1 PIG-L family deacetylase [Microcoleus sp. FACHB-1515]
MTALPLTNPVELPLRSITTIDPGCVLIVAPHPDDEALGCGGAIALLRSLNYEVRVLVVSDGTLSHPRSRKYPAPVLRNLREQETLTALSLLGVNAAEVTFLRLPDGALSTLISSPEVCAIFRQFLSKISPSTIFLPWRFDPHPDHRSTWQLVHTAIADLGMDVRQIEYPIWDWDIEQRDTVKNSATVTSWRLDIQTVVNLKQQAIAAYRSQTTGLIDDDPEAFRLTPEMLANFLHPWELYCEEV